MHHESLHQQETKVIEPKTSLPLGINVLGSDRIAAHSLGAIVPFCAYYRNEGASMILYLNKFNFSYFRLPIPSQLNTAVLSKLSPELLAKVFGCDCSDCYYTIICPGNNNKLSN